MQAESRAAQRDHILACCQRFDAVGQGLQGVDPLPTRFRHSANAKAHPRIPFAARACHARRSGSNSGLFLALFHQVLKDERTALVQQRADASQRADVAREANVIYNRLAKDSTALTLCMDNNMPIHVFNMDDESNIDRIVSGERVGTLVHPPVS